VANKKYLMDTNFGNNSQRLNGPGGRFYLLALPLLTFCWLGIVAFFLRGVKT